MSYEPSTYPDGGGFYRSKRRPVDYMPKIDSKMVQYAQDGTGRDVYISANNGGFCPQKTVAEYRQGFFDSFRTYERPRTNEYLN